MDQAEFERQWSSLKVKNYNTGLDKFFIAIAPKDTKLPPSRKDGAGLALTVLDGIGAGEKAIGFGKQVADFGQQVAEGAKNTWNNVKGWFGR
ncbi:hypothetical protein D3C86_1923790 [compost metagenome]